MFKHFGQLSEEELQQWVEKDVVLVYLVDKSTSSISVSDLELHYYLNYKFYVFLKTRPKNKWFFIDDSAGISPMMGLVYTSSLPVEDEVLVELKDYVKKYVEPIHNN